MAGETTPPDFAALFRARAGSKGVMTFAQFMDLALYDPGLGYYRRDRARIGYGEGTDFFTASTSGPLFGELVAAACVDLLGGRDPRGFVFIEIGADRRPGSAEGILAGVDHPFGAARTISFGETLSLGGPCVVFSNELFDAQPFRRFVHRRGKWREMGVAIEDNGFAWTELAIPDEAPPPASAPEGYVFDAPLAATALAKRIAALPWTGLYLAFDYGKSLHELANECPEGTARAYRRHAQSNDLLAHPGDQDLTCHVCWDWLVDALRQKGFAEPAVESQEAFFVAHAAPLIERIAAAEASRLSQRKLSLLQLLHPAHLGQKFQVLHALRD